MPNKHKFIRIEPHHAPKVTKFVHENFCKRGREPLCTMLSDEKAEYSDTLGQIKKWTASYIKAGHSWMICDEDDTVLAVALNFLRKAPLKMTISEQARYKTYKLLQHFNSYAYYWTVEFRLMKKLGSYSFYRELEAGDNALFIQLVAVSGNCQRQGLGKKLVDSVLEIEKKNAKMVVAQATNQGSMGLFKRMGFKVDNSLKYETFQDSYGKYPFHGKLVGGNEHLYLMSRGLGNDV